MKKRILFVNDEMCVGGVSKVLNNLLRHINTDKYEVDLLVLHYHGEMIGDIPENINVIKGSDFFSIIDEPISTLTKNKEYIKIFSKIKMYYLVKTGLIRKKINKERKSMKLVNYDVEVAFKEGFCSIFVASGNTPIKVNWIHADYKVMNYAKNYMNVMPNILNDFTYHVAVSKVAAISFKEVFNLNNDVTVIHNIIEEDVIIAKSKEDVDYRDEVFSFVTVGRLHPQKSYDRLVSACSRLQREGSIFKLYIIGDGEMYGLLKKLIKDKGLTEVVYLLGSQTNPFKYLKQADCFVLSSIYEGLPTVIFESMILKVPVFALDVAGVDEQLQSKYGIVVENNEDSLYMGMKELIENPEILVKYRDYLENYHYDNNKILENIYSLFEGNHE